MALITEETARERLIDELRAENEQLKTSLLALEVDTRCREHQGNHHNHYCAVCGRPMAWLAGEEPRAYKALKAENARLDAALADTASELTDAVRENEQLQAQLENNKKAKATRRKTITKLMAENKLLRQERDEAREALSIVAVHIDSDVEPVKKSDLKNALAIIQRCLDSTSGE